MQNLPFVKLVCPFLLVVYLSENINQQFPIEYNLLLLLLGICGTLIIENLGKPLLSNLNIYIQILLLGYICSANFNTYKQKYQAKRVENKQFLIFTINQIEEKNSKYIASAKLNFYGIPSSMICVDSGIKIYFKDKLDARPGDQYLAFSSLLFLPGNKNPKVFDYKKFLERKGIFYQTYLKKENRFKLAEGKLDYLNQLAANKRKDAFNIFHSANIGNENLSIISAMVLGIRSLINDQINQEFRRTGAVHILAVSGLHVGIVSSFLLLIFTQLKLKSTIYKAFKLLSLLLAVWAFVLISGSSPSVVRAAMMFSLFYIGLSAGRTASIYNIIAFTAMVMLIYNPNSIYEIGFQFSFLALTSIVFFFNRIDSLIFISSKSLRKIWHLIVLSVSAQLLVFPLSIYYFNMFPVYFFLSGIVAVPLAGISIILSISLLGCYPLHLTAINKSVSFLLEHSINFLRIFISKIEQLPYSCIEGIYIDKFSVFLLYLSILLIICGLHRRKVTYLVIAGILLLTQSMYALHCKIKAWNKSELYVYDIYNNSLVDLFIDGNLYTVQNTSISPSNISFNSYNNKLSHFTDLEDAHVLNTQEYPAYKLNNRLYLLYPDKEINYPSSTHIDYLFVNKTSSELVDYYLDNYSIGHVIIDSSIKKMNDDWISAMNAKDISFHFTKTSGPIKIKL